MMVHLRRLQAHCCGGTAVFLPLALAGEDAYITGTLTTRQGPAEATLRQLRGRSFRTLGWRAMTLLPAAEPARIELPLPGMGPTRAFGGLVTTDAHVLGWLGVLEREGAPPPRRRARKAWAAAADAIRTAPGTPAVLLPAPGRFVFTETGRPWMRTPPDPSAPEFEAALGAVIREHSARGGDHHITVLHGAVVQMTRMRGAGGTGWLVEAQPGHAPPIPTLAQLTEAQRTVATFAAAGATANEIARAMDRSPETVRTHLKRAYAALGIANRVELNRMVEAEWHTPS